MKRSRHLSHATLQDGVRALVGRDPWLAAIAARWGMPPLWARRPGFATLVHIILEQQVSLPAAATLYKRLARHAGCMSPQAIAALGADGLRAFGLTRQKSAFCDALATRVLDGRLDLALVSRAPDAAARAMLLEVPGLGPWSVDIYFLMALRRPDIWPQGDLALAVTLRDRLALPKSPGRVEQAAFAERWAPWRSVAARLLWLEYLATRGRYVVRPDSAAPTST
ncbi:MAG: DNA-3-methyladenine glycosylase 2 family protein [Gemmatimonadota bacterium]